VAQAAGKQSKDHLKRVSKFLSFVLRHNPAAGGLVLDEHGWASVPRLLETAPRDLRLTADLIRHVVLTNDKQRFSLSEDGMRIRANQGHSIDVDLGLTAVRPPTRLFHGTATRHLDAIWAQGLLPGERTHVHLSGDIETARAVGRRHGKPAVLAVAAEAMFEANHAFFLSANGIWLTATVPPSYLSPVEPSGDA